MIPTQFLIDFIQSSGSVTSEYQLLKWIEKNHPEFFASLEHEPSLFKKHFFLFHHLYKLREKLLVTGQSLLISSVEIRICQNNQMTGGDLAEPDGLTAFYSNIDNLNLNEDQVSEMLDQFWKKYLAIDKKAQAILFLGLENNEKLDLPMIRNRFNQLAHQYHPDKGGEDEYFFQLKQAYNTLKCLY